ncbi:MAG: ABC transporter permease [Nitrospirota bacterium]
MIPSFEMAFLSLKSNKTRAALTILGVVIGVAAVLSMIAIAEGTNRRMKKEIESLGSNLLLVLPGAATSGGARIGLGGVTTLIYDDVLATEKLDTVQSAIPVVRRVVQAVYGNLNWATSVIGTTPAYETVREWPVKDGRYFTQQEMESQTKVCVIGKTVVENLFIGEDPIGKTIRLNRLPFTVVGVLEEKGSSPQGQDQDDVILVPLYTAQRKIIGITYITAMLVKAREGRLNDAQRDVEILLRQRHRIPEREENDFTVRNLSEILGMMKATSDIIGLMLGAVASVSLIVGGIGIMNIMLVSVTERTREIGLRRALGAKRRDIKRQFLIEALVLCGFGGMVGVLFGLISIFLLSSLGGWEFALPIWAILLSFLFSIIVGVIFGLYPASKASLVEPIIALRYE